MYNLLGYLDMTEIYREVILELENLMEDGKFPILTDEEKDAIRVDKQFERHPSLLRYITFRNSYFNHNFKG